MRRKPGLPPRAPLFDALDRLGRDAHRIHVPMDEIFAGEPETPAERRDEGIRRAVAHADSEQPVPKWSDQADIYTRNWLRRRGDAPFLMEEIVGDAKREGLPDPPDKRAFGGVIRRLARDRAVFKDGVGEAKTSNCSLKPKWRRNPDWSY